MTTIRQILGRKGHKIASIGPDETVFRALQMLAEHDIGSLLVIDGDQLVGILSERDYARRVILEGRSSLDTPVRDVMVTDLVTANPDELVEHCMSVMTDRHIRHLPVLEDSKLIGLVSIGDLVKSVIDDQKSTIDQLVDYVSGST